MSDLTNIPDDHLIDRDYGRKPYLSRDYTEMVRRVPDAAMFAQRDERQSEFKKPYLSDSYEEMEQFFMPPFPGFVYPSFVFPDFPGPVPVFGDDEWMDAHQDGGGLPCSISCISNRGAKDPCNAPVKCGWNLVTPPGTAAGWSIVRNRDGKKIEIGKINVDDGVVFPVKIYPPAGGWSVNVDTGKQSFRMRIKYKDAGGSTCMDEVTVYCDASCQCPADPALAFDDDNTPDTIAPGWDNKIEVFVTGGCPPFTWSTSSNGYSFVYSSTEDRYNFLRCDSGT